MWKEFKEFALKGNVLDMAVGVIVGGAFGKIVSSLVNDIIMPIFGYLTAGMEFSALKIVLSPAVVENGEVVKAEAAILYGSFIQNIVDFLIIALSIFFMIRLISRAHHKRKAEEPPAPPAPPAPTQEELLTEIRDLLRARQDGEK